MSEQKLLSPRIVLTILCLLHVIFALWFNSQTPYRMAGVSFIQGRTAISDIGAPDERQHANYVLHLMQGKGFPVFNPADTSNLYENYQSHQPPLYYVLASGWTAIGSTLLNAPLEDLGKSQSSLGHFVRALNSIFGIALVLAAFAFTRRLSGSDVTGIVGAALVALLPMSIALSSAINNDVLLFALCGWSGFYLLKLSQDEFDLRDAIVLGFLLGLASLTKTNALALWPACLITAIAFKKLGSKQVWISVAIGLLLPLGWWLRNAQLYGDPFALTAFSQAFTGSAQAADFIKDLGPFTYWTQWVGWWTLRSFVGVFGYMDIWLTNTGTQSGMNSLYLLWIILLAGGLGTSFFMLASDRRKLLLPGAVLTAVVLILFLRFNAQYFQAQARYLFPALVPIAAFVAIGWTGWYKARPNLIAYLICGLLLVTSIFAGTRLGPEFERRMNTPAAAPR